MSRASNALKFTLEYFGWMYLSFVFAFVVFVILISFPSAGRASGSVGRTQRLYLAIGTGEVVLNLRPLSIAVLRKKWALTLSFHISAI